MGLVGSVQGRLPLPTTAMATYSHFGFVGHRARERRKAQDFFLKFRHQPQGSLNLGIEFGNPSPKVARTP